jgi:O-antigen/teichoic acid export membrane protein
MTERHGKQRLVANTLATALAQFGALAIAFLLAPLLIRAFGPAAYGAYMLVTSVSAFLLLLDFGLGPALEKLLAERLATQRTSGGRTRSRRWRRLRR